MVKYFTKEHEWIDVDGDKAKIGITDYAQKQLGDIVFVELPEVGAKIEQEKDFAVVESVKAASEVYAPLSGEVVTVNVALSASPDLVNTAAEQDGWFVVVNVFDKEQVASLMSEQEYKDYIKGA